MSNQQADVQWFHAVQAAFPDEELRKRIWVEAHQPTQLPQLFEDIARHVLSIKAQQEQHQSQDLPSNPKKRKLDDGTAPANGTHIPTPAGIESGLITFEVKDVSVQIPARKKLRIEILRDSANEERHDFRLVPPTSSTAEYSLSVGDIGQVFCLPVPDKQQKQSYFAILPKPGATTAKGDPAEQVLFTLNETSPPTSISSKESEVREDDTYVTATLRLFTQLLQRYGKKVVVPDAAEFASARVQAHRKGEKGYHVSCYRGSKEGYLFFLPTGILFGFKKPLVFYPFHNIESISYTSVLQRTFNLVIAATKNGSEDTEETEFSMLDQEDFQGIDEYVKRHGLNDASLAAGRRAKEYGVNKPKGEKGEVNGDAAAAAAGGAAGVGAVAGGEVGEDGLTELQRAEQELQDLEDEEEEDYEASGGESDGEGESSGDEDEDGEGEGYEEGEDGEEDAEGEVEGEMDEDEL